MESLRKLGQTCRQHYEKLVLSAALLIFAAAVYLIQRDSVVQREEIRKIDEGYDQQKVKGVRRVDLAAGEAALKQAAAPATASFSPPHHLVNPLKWESRNGGEPRKIKSSDDVGPKAMEIVKITPLLLTIAYGSPSTSGNEGDLKVNGYWTFSTNDLAAPRSPKRLVRAFVSETETNQQALFVLRGVQGDPKEPTELLAELKDPPGEKFTFAPGKPYTRVLGHEVLLRYKPNSWKSPALRVGSPLEIDGVNYKVVDITPSAVVVSDNSNEQPYTITSFVK